MKRFKPYLIGGGILAGAALVMVLLIALRPEPPKSDPPPQSPLVSTTTAEGQQGNLTVRGNGTVRPTVQIELTAEVGGQLVSVSDALVSGGSFEAGDLLARIDPTDYENAVDQAEAQVTQREFELLQTQEEAGIAREEYQRLRQRTGSAPEPDSTSLGRLVFKEPQLKRARANLQSAKATLSNAEAQLRRTYIRAPFNGMVRTKRADLGAYVAPGTPIATIYGTDAVEIVVSLTSREAALIGGLWATKARRGRTDIPATVSAEYGGRRYTWEGYVDRVEGALDEQTRTVDVVVRVPQPYDSGTSDAGTVESQASEGGVQLEQPPLAIGQYTTVDIQGRQLDDYIVVPRQSVRDGDVVWTVENDTMLVERPVEIIQVVEEDAYLAPDIAPGTPVITSDLRVHTDSMRIRLADSVRE